MQSASMRGLFYAVSAVLALLLALGAHVTRDHAFSHHLQTQRYRDQYYLPPPDWLKVGSLGYREALADMVWISALNNFGQELGHGGHAKYVYHYADAMLALDPNFRRVYLWIANVSIYRPSASMADMKRAARYLEDAVRRFPDDGDLLWNLGAHYTYEMAPTAETPEEHDAVKARGLPYLQAAALLGAGPPWLGLITSSGLASLGKKEQAIAHLSELYMTVEDPETKAQISERLAYLKNATFAEALGRSEVLFRQHKEAQLPYLSDTLYVLVGPRPPFDGAGQLKRYFDPVPEHFAEAAPP